MAGALSIAYLRSARAAPILISACSTGILPPAAETASLSPGRGTARTGRVAPVGVQSVETRCAGQAPSLSIPLLRAGPTTMTIKDPAIAAEPIEPSRNSRRLLWFRVIALLLPVLFFVFLV